MNLQVAKNNISTQELFSDLLINQDYMNKIFGYAYKRTSSRIEAEDLTQEIIAELIAAFNKNPSVDSVNGYLWKIANNTYVDWVKRARGMRETSFEEVENIKHETNNVENEVLSKLFDEHRYGLIMREMAFLSKIHRDVMVMFYLDERPISEIAKILDIPENRVKQRLFSAKEKIRKEVNVMEKNLSLKPNELWLSGSGDFTGGDPRNHIERLLSKNTLILCKDKAKTVEELAKELNLPAIFMEDELNILKNCGLLKQTAGGKYITDFIIVDWEVQKHINKRYEEYSVSLINETINFIDINKDKILKIKYLVQPESLSFILWTLVPRIAHYYKELISRKVVSVLSDKGIKQEHRRYFIVGTIVNPNECNENIMGFYSWNGNTHNDLAGYRSVHLSQFNGKRLPYRFGYMGISNNPEYLLLLNCINGLSIDSLTENKKELASKAIAHKLIKKKGNMLYPNILVFDRESYSQFETLIFEFESQINELTDSMVSEYVELIKKHVPQHLMGQSELFTDLTGSMMNYLIERSIEKGLLYVPDMENCAEGVWSIVERKEE